MSILQNEVTTVSCYYKIPSKHDFIRYECWISNFISYYARSNKPCLIFTNQTTLNFLTKKYIQPSNIIYMVVEIDKFITSLWDEKWIEQELMDSEITIGHSKNLYKIWNEKLFFVDKAIKSNIFNTTHFAWVDIGCMRIPQKLSNFPNPNKIIDNKVTILQIQPFNPNECTNCKTINNRFKHVNRIGGTIFAGDKYALTSFIGMHYNLLNFAIKNNVFVGKDQSLYAFAVINNPEIFNLIAPDKNINVDQWFYLLKFLD